MSPRTDSAIKRQALQLLLDHPQLYHYVFSLGVEKAAHLVERWHIKKGGYCEMAWQVRKLKELGVPKNPLYEKHHG